MTLMITLLAAVVASIVWYSKAPNSTFNIGSLALMYWAATLMWCVDGIACLIEGEAFIEIADTAAMLDDAVLGIVVVIVGLAVWAVINIARDPKRIFSKALTK